MDFSHFKSWDWWKSASGLWTAAAIVSALLLPVIFFFPGKEPAAAKTLSAQTADKAPIALVTARLDTNTFEKWQIETLHVTVLNRGKDTLTGLNVQVLAPGFEFEQPALDACTVVDGTKGVRELKPNQTCTVAVPLKAISASGSYSVAVKVGWFQGEPKNPLLTLGTLHMRAGFGAERWQRFGARLAQVFKDLTFPLLLLLLTTQLGSWQKDRETRQEQDEKRRAADEKLRQDEQARKDAIADQRRTDQQQVRQLLLNKVNDRSEEYYLKISAAGKGVLDAYADFNGVANASTERLFYCTMLMCYHFLELKDDHGGVFFQDRDAETIVSYCWGMLKPTLFEVVGEDQVLVARKLLKQDNSFASFQNALNSLASSSKRFSEWCQDTSQGIGEYLNLFDAIQAVCQFETNVPLNEYWYRKSTPLRYRSVSFRVPQPTKPTEGQKKAAAELPALFEAYRLKNEKSQQYD